MHEGQPITLTPPIHRMLTTVEVNIDDVKITEHDRGPTEFLADVDVDCEEFGWAQLEFHLNLDNSRLKITGSIQPRKGKLYDVKSSGIGPVGSDVTVESVADLMQDILETSSALEDLRTMSMLWEAQGAREQAERDAEVRAYRNQL